MRPSQVNVHITRGYFTAAMLEDRGGLELSYAGDKQFPLDALPAFEASLTARGYVRLPGVFDWLRHYQHRPDKPLSIDQSSEGERETA